MDDSLLESKQTQDEFATRAKRGMALQYFEKGVKTVVSLASLMVLGRLLEPDDYGLLGMVAPLLIFLTLFKTMGLTETTIQRDDLTQEQVSTTFWIIIGIGGCLTILMAAGAPLVAWFFGDERLLNITIVLSLSILLSTASEQHLALLKRNLLFKQISAVNIVVTVVAAATAVGLAFGGFGYWALVARGIVGGVLATLLFWAIVDWKPSLTWSTERLKEDLAFGGNLSASNLLYFINRQLDDILVGRFGGAKELGYYNRAYQLLMLPMTQLTGPLATVMLPMLSRLRDDPERYKRTYLIVVDKMLLATVPAGVLLAVYSDWAIVLVLGTKWVFASDMLRAFTPVLLLQPLGSTFGWLWISQGRTREQFRWNIPKTALLVVGMLAGLPWGGVGVAAGTSIAMIVMFWPLNLYPCFREGPISSSELMQLFPKHAIAGATSAVAALICRQYLDYAVWANFAIGAAVLLLSHLTALCLLPSGRKSIMELIRLVRSVTER